MKTKTKIIKGLSDKYVKGWYQFYWNGHDITPFWMDFFSSLSPKDERHCSEIFTDRYSKELNKKYPLSKRTN